MFFHREKNAFVFNQDLIIYLAKVIELWLEDVKWIDLFFLNLKLRGTLSFFGDWKLNLFVLVSLNFDDRDFRIFDHKLSKPEFFI